LRICRSGIGGQGSVLALLIFDVNGENGNGRFPRFYSLNLNQGFHRVIRAV
jgi:hypothetical protein